MTARRVRASGSQSPPRCGARIWQPAQWRGFWRCSPEDWLRRLGGGERQGASTTGSAAGGQHASAASGSSDREFGGASAPASGRARGAHSGGRSSEADAGAEWLSLQQGDDAGSPNEGFAGDARHRVPPIRVASPATPCQRMPPTQPAFRVAVGRRLAPLSAASPHAAPRAAASRHPRPPPRAASQHPRPRQAGLLAVIGGGERQRWRLR